MSRVEKLALLMIALGSDASSTLLKRFEAKTLKIFAKNSGFPIVEQELQSVFWMNFQPMESSVNSNLEVLFAQKSLEMPVPTRPTI